MERRKYLCRHGEIQLTSSKEKKKKKRNLEQEKSFQDSDPRRASERFLTGFDTRGQLNHGPVFAQM